MSRSACWTASNCKSIRRFSATCAQCQCECFAADRMTRTWRFSGATCFRSFTVRARAFEHLTVTRLVNYSSCKFCVILGLPDYSSTTDQHWCFPQQLTISLFTGSIRAATRAPTQIDLFSEGWSIFCFHYRRLSLSSELQSPQSEDRRPSFEVSQVNSFIFFSWIEFREVNGLVSYQLGWIVSLRFKLTEHVAAGIWRVCAFLFKLQFISAAPLTPLVHLTVLWCWCCHYCSKLRLTCLSFDICTAAFVPSERLSALQMHTISELIPSEQGYNCAWDKSKD